MPVVFDYLGLIFRFYSDEHYPIHIHVQRGEFESIYDLIIVNNMLVELKRRKKRGVEHLSVSDAKKAEEFIRANWDKIAKKWADYFVLNIPIKSVKITKKI